MCSRTVGVHVGMIARRHDSPQGYQLNRACPVAETDHGSWFTRWPWGMSVFGASSPLHWWSQSPYPISATDEASYRAVLGRCLTRALIAEGTQLTCSCHYVTLVQIRALYVLQAL